MNTSVDKGPGRYKEVNKLESQARLCGNWLISLNERL